MISIGGPNSSADFKRISKSFESMDKFTDSCLEFMQKYKFDGLDINWETPDEDDK